ncbi:hypothetical protein Tco_0760224 [Tanacetum coccineum]
MSSAVARGHGGDGAGDPPRPRGRKATKRCKGGDMNGGRKGVRKEIRNIKLKRAVKGYGPQQINFEWKDKKGCFISNQTLRGSVTMELVREFLMHYPSWYGIEDYKKAHIKGRLMVVIFDCHFDLRPHMLGPRWTDTEKGVEQYFAKRYADNKHNLKRDYWNVKVGETRDVEAIRSQPSLNVEPSDWEAHIIFWLDLKNAA